MIVDCACLFLIFVYTYCIVCYNDHIKVEHYCEWHWKYRLLRCLSFRLLQLQAFTIVTGINGQR